MFSIRLANTAIWPVLHEFAKINHNADRSNQLQHPEHGMKRAAISLHSEASFDASVPGCLASNNLATFGERATEIDMFVFARNLDLQTS